MDVDETPSLFETRQINVETDFELPDYWDEGEVLGGREKWPVCVTLNVVSTTCVFIQSSYQESNFLNHQIPPVHYLDATPQEEASTPLRMLLVYSSPSSKSPTIQAMRILSPGEFTLIQLKDLVKVGIFNIHRVSITSTDPLIFIGGREIRRGNIQGAQRKIEGRGREKNSKVER